MLLEQKFGTGLKGVAENPIGLLWYWQNIRIRRLIGCLEIAPGIIIIDCGPT